MSTPEPVEPSPSRWGAVWKWSKRLTGCLGLALLLSCGCLTCGTGGIYWYHDKSLREGADEVFRDGLASGNADTMYDNADEAFRLRYTRDVFLEFLARHPELLNRGQLAGTLVQRPLLDGRLYFVVRVKLDRGGAAVELAIYCKVGDDGVVRLLGISGGLDAAVPGALVRIAFPKKSRSHLFD